jgi:hypothetical protein
MVRRVLTSAGFTAVTLTAPTDSGLLAKAVNRIAAIGRRIRAAGGAVRTKLRDRSRAAGRRAHDLNANCGPAALPPRRRRRWRWCGARTLSWRIWPRPPPTRPNACCGTRNRAWLRPAHPPPQATGPADRLRRPAEDPLRRPERRRTLLQQAQEMARHREALRQDRPPLPRWPLPRRHPPLAHQQLEHHVLGTACCEVRLP